MRPPEKCMRIHLPLASTSSTVRPRIPSSKSTRASFGKTVSNLVMVCPANARFSVRCAKDGIAFRHLSHLRSALFVRIVIFVVERFHDAGDSSHVIASGSVGKPGFFEKTAE